MLLHTPLYLIFLSIVYILVWAFQDTRLRKFILLAASYVFYCLFDPRFAILLGGLTLINYYLGFLAGSSKYRPLGLILNLIVNLGVLGVFKYYDFFISSLQPGQSLIGAPASTNGLRLLLPIGISFYTFQAIAYGMEIWRGKLQPAASLWDFGLYLAFFPRLIAGPFVRAADFFKQIVAPASRPKAKEVSGALRLLILGLFKKIVIADSLATISAVAFRASEWPGGGAFPAPLYWQGFYLYAFQIYTDFSGYTDIARASAALLGIALPENFYQPYLTSTPAAFWNAWHITLTHWFREYLFFPLSRFLLKLTRRRFQQAAQVLATLITMSLIGLWHGAAWTYVIWGAWHGLLVALDRQLKLRPSKTWQKIVLSMITFHLVGIGWIFFRASSLSAAGRFLAGLVSGEQWIWVWHYLPSVLFTGFLVFAIDGLTVIRMAEKPAWKRWRTIVLIAALVIIISLWVIHGVGGEPTEPFIYGRF